MGGLGTEFKVGLFTLIALVILGYMLFILSPDSFQTNKNREYYTVVEDAAGIVNKTQVKTNGVVVGKVTRIKLEVNQTRVTFALESHVKIPSGSKVAIKEKGLLGDVFIEIIRGPDTGHYIEPGGFIEPDKDHVSMSGLISVAGDIGKDIKEITKNLATVLGGEEGQKNIGETSGNFKDLAEQVKLMVEENRTSIHNLVKNLEDATSTVKAVLGDREQDLQEIVSNIQLASRDLKSFADSMSGIVDEKGRDRIQKILASFDNTMQEIELTAKNVRLVADKIESGNGTLGKLISDDKALAEIEGAVKDLRKVLAPATRLQFEVDYHGELRQDKTTQHYFNTYLRTRPDRFYILGFTDNRETVVEKVDETIPLDDPSSDAIGTGSKTRERIVEKKAIRFNLQFGKRWHDVQLRFGLFESTGGIGADLYLFEDVLRFSLDAFDWSNQSNIRRTAHLKAYLTFFFYKHLYLVAGIDDPTVIGGAKNYFVGAGVNFLDEDLKAIFGTASLAF